MILRVLYDSRHLTRKMDVFDKQYHSYRTVMKIVGLWPYNNSIYIWIQRSLLLTFFLGNVIFQVIKIDFSLWNFIVFLLIYYRIVK